MLHDNDNASWVYRLRQFTWKPVWIIIIFSSMVLNGVSWFDCGLRLTKSIFFPKFQRNHFTFFKIGALARTFPVRVAEPDAMNLSIQPFTSRE